MVALTVVRRLFCSISIQFGFKKEITMPRPSKFLLVFVWILFILACNFVTQPIKDVQNVASTVESVASALPVETLQSLATNLPVGTLEALPSSIPDFGNFFNPQGTPVAKWNGIPIMPEATAGQEFDASTYSFKVDATVKEVQDFYNAQLKELGWEQPFNLPAQGDGGLMVFQKDNHILTITLTSIDGAVVALLTLA